MWRRTEDIFLSRRKNALDKGLFEVACLGKTAKVDSFSNEHSKFHLGHDWSIDVRTMPLMLVKVAKGNNAILSTLGFTIFVGFDCRNCHAREGLTKGITEEVILCFSDIFEGINVLKAVIFFSIGRIPSGFVIGVKGLVIFE